MIDIDDIDFEDFYDFDTDEWVGELYGVWRMRDGRLIRFKQMTDSHIVNTLAFIERTDSDYEFGRVYRALKREQKRRTEKG